MGKSISCAGSSIQSPLLTSPSHAPVSSSPVVSPPPGPGALSFVAAVDAGSPLRGAAVLQQEGGTLRSNLNTIIELNNRASIPLAITRDLNTLPLQVLRGYDPVAKEDTSVEATRRRLSGRFAFLPDPILKWLGSLIARFISTVPELRLSADVLQHYSGPQLGAKVINSLAPQTLLDLRYDALCRLPKATREGLSDSAINILLQSEMLDVKNWAKAMQINNCARRSPEGLTAAQLNGLSKVSIAHLDGLVFNRLPPREFQHLSHNFLNGLSNEAFQTLSPELINGLNGTTLENLYSAKLIKLSSETIKGLEIRTLQGFSEYERERLINERINDLLQSTILEVSNWAPAAQLNLKMIRLPHSQGQIDLGDLRSLMAALPIASIPYLNICIFERLKNDSRIIPHHVINRLSDAMWQQLPIEVFNGLSNDTIKELISLKFTALPEATLKQLRPRIFNMLNETEKARLTAEIMNKLSAQTIKKLSPELLNGLSVPCLEGLSQDFVTRLIEEMDISIPDRLSDKTILNLADKIIFAPSKPKALGDRVRQLRGIEQPSNQVDEAISATTASKKKLPAFLSGLKLDNKGAPQAASASGVSSLATFPKKAEAAISSLKERIKQKS